MIKNGVGELKFFHINQENVEFSSGPLYWAAGKYLAFHHWFVNKDFFALSKTKNVHILKR